MLIVELIVAMDTNRGIGKDGGLPWQLSTDLRHFREVTCRTAEAGKSNVVVMGRRTWVSIPQKFQPLPDRINLILSRNPEFSAPEGVLVARSIDEVVHVLEKSGDEYEKIFIIGGEQIYTAALASVCCQRIHVTQIEQDFDCDAFFPTLDDKYKLISSSPSQNENGIDFSFMEYEFQPNEARSR